MKRTAIYILLFFMAARGADIPFRRGVNLTGWLQTSGAKQIQFTKFTKQDLLNIKGLGCDVIRLPIDLHAMNSGAPDYTLDPLFLSFLCQIVDWAEELEIHLILDNHSFDPAEDTQPEIVDILLPVWTQMADHFKERSHFLYYEVLNEPHGISDGRWNDIQQRVIDAIRAKDVKHTIVIGPAGWNSYNNLRYMPVYEDDNLIYTFHFYDPFLFTHQGASWTDPSMESLAGVPFPYNATRMPNCPPDLRGTWIQSALSSYRNDGTVKRVEELIAIAADFKNERDIPIFCGEFGVYIPNSDSDERIDWYNLVRTTFETHGIAWTIWDYTGGFGLFKPGGSDLFEYDLNIPLVEALGLTPPEQKKFILRPDSTGFDLYRDYIAPHVFESSWAGDGIVDYYSETDPVEGEYCIYWTGVGQYSNIGFDFKPIKDLTVLVARGYALDFWVRGDSPGSRFDIRFIDTKTADPGDHPWRMRRTIDNTMAIWNGEWNHLQILLKSFTEHGSWDGDWFNPQGDYDWSATDRFEIVSEHHDLQNIQFWFDNIRIVNPKNVDGDDNSAHTPDRDELYQNYPNPFNSETNIDYRLIKRGRVEISIVNAVGRKIRTLVDQLQDSGTHSAVWNGLDENGRGVSSGLYLCEMKSSEDVHVRKMILMR